MHPDELKEIKVRKSLHYKVRDLMAKKKEKSPRAFYIGLSLIAVSIIAFMTIFFVVQSQTALAANIYKPKAVEYLDNFYNQLTIKIDSYKDQTTKLEKIAKPKLEQVFLGWLNYKYAQNVVLSSEIDYQTNLIFEDFRKNEEFYNFIDDLSLLKKDLIDLGERYKSASSSQKSDILTLIKERFEAFSNNMEKYSLPEDLQTSQKNLKTDYSLVSDAFANMANYYKQNNKLIFAGSSYEYMKVNDYINTENTKIQSYQNTINDELKTSIERFKQFVDEVKK